VWAEECQHQHAREQGPRDLGCPGKRRASQKPIVTAGLMCAPETSPTA
jgi:hypothetical protein